MHVQGVLSQRKEVVLHRDIAVSKPVVLILSALTFLVITALGAYVRIPLLFTPVPVTLQTLAVLLAAICLGSRVAGATYICYLMLGCAGMPLFAGATSGIAYMLGPTGGYLMGFIIAGVATGYLIRRNHNFGWTFFSVSVGAFIILFSGTMWLTISMHLPFAKALMLGFIPFLPGDILKVLIATYFYRTFKEKFKGF